ncbi:MAG TPA: cyclase family protein [Bryobacteraceae bacterium]|jgi:kynurenine formamidase
MSGGGRDPGLVFVDLSHTVEQGMVTYRGLPAPLICDFLSREASRAHYSPGTEFQIGRIDMVANTGTYLDSPFHRYADGRDLAQLTLESLAHLDAVVVRAGASRTIGAISFRDVEVRGKAVLVATGWDRHWRTDAYFEGHPFLTKDAAEYLAKEGAVLVGIDSYNIDDTADGSRPVHTILLGANIPICEHMCHLERLPDKNFRFSAVPVKVAAMGSFPVRAFALLEGPCSGA